MIITPIYTKIIFLDDILYGDFFKCSAHKTAIPALGNMDYISIANIHHYMGIPAKNSKNTNWFLFKISKDTAGNMGGPGRCNQMLAVKKYFWQNLYLFLLVGTK